jgi:hypothetical protein
MDGSRLNRLKVKLQIGDWNEMDQKQFNDLVTNLSYLDQETIRHVIRNVPDLSEKVLNYFSQLNESTKINLEDYLDSMKSHQQILSDLFKEDIGQDTKNKIADELLEHSKWLRKEATVTRVFKMAVTAIGLGLAFVFIHGMGKSANYRPHHARVPDYKKEEGYDGGNQSPDRFNDYNAYPPTQTEDHYGGGESYQAPEDSDEEFDKKLHHVSQGKHRAPLRGAKISRDRNFEKRVLRFKAKKNKGLFEMNI